MEAVIIILLIVILILISKQNGKLKLIDRRIIDLSKFLNEKQFTSREEIQKSASSLEHDAKPAPSVVESQETQEELHIDTGIDTSESEVEPAIAFDAAEEANNESGINTNEDPVKEAEKQYEPVLQSSSSAHSLKQIIASHKGLPKNKVQKKSFLDRNPDLEKFIGENLLSKIGIIIFVIGMGFLVKLGIDNDIITEPLRIAIGVLVGGIMVGLAHYLRVSFANFSSILIGGALAVLYFTIALGYHEYNLIPQSAAFIIMIAITGFGVFLSIAYDRKTLAILAIIGGFGTPFFLSTGEGNLVALIIYILILDLGMLVLAYFKKWNILTYIAYAFSYLLFIGAYNLKFLENPEVARLPLFIFLTSVYVIFFFMTIAYNIRYNLKFSYREIGMLLTNSSLYLGFGLLIVGSYNNGQLNGLFTALVAIFNFGFTIILYRRKDVDKNLLFLLIGLVLTFVSLVAPIQLQGNYITMFWAFEAVLLLWLSKKSGIELMKFVSIIVASLMLASLSMDWFNNYLVDGYNNNLSLFLNKPFLASIVSVASLIGLIVLLKKGVVVEFRNIKFTWTRSHVNIALLIVVYLAFLFEFLYQVDNAELQNSLGVILVGIYNFIFISVLFLIGRFSRLTNLRTVAFWAALLFIVLYPSIYNAQVIDSRSYNIISQGISAGFAWHYLMLALWVYILIEACLYFHKEYSFKSSIGEKAIWALSLLGVLVVSLEVSHIVMVTKYSSTGNESVIFDGFIRSVLPIVWTISALLLMIAGMKLRLKTLRIVSLVLFTATIIKLFMFDLAGNTTGRIVSFILLGVILLVISFLYQKLKFIIQDDNKKDIE